MAISTHSEPTRTYREFTATTSFKERVRNTARSTALRIMSIGRDIGRTENAVWFPFYHHVFEDERAGFAAHLDELRRYGDFISMDDALEMLNERVPLDGRYFCLSFDDGLKSCYDGAFPMLAERDIPAIFYLVTNLIGESLEPDDHRARHVFGFKGADTTLDFMTWDNCREMAEGGMVFGSHTSNHVNLLACEYDMAYQEMRESKAVIEHEIGACDHFCPPYGIPGVHYDPIRESKLAQDCGYRSFVTGLRGPNRPINDPFAVHRDQLLANWPSYQLRYFFSRH